MTSPDRAILEAVRSALTGRGRIVLAVSGGVDSMSLLDAAARVIDADRLVVATFDHGTGSHATDAVALVRSRAAELGLVVESACAATQLRSEAELRQARWSFLRDTATRAGARVATAHTADDQVETVLMRLMRGAGARGLAGLEAPGGPLRPFGRLSRAQLEAYARARGLVWLEDPSNASRAFFRNRIRHDLLPALARVQPGLAGELLAIGVRAAAWRRDVDRFVTAHVPVAPLRRTSAPSHAFEVGTEALGGMSPAELSILWPSIAARFGVTLDRRGITRLTAFTRQSRVGSRIQLSGGWSVVRSRGGLTFATGTVDAPEAATIGLFSTTVWGAWSFQPSPGEGSDADGLWSFRLPTDVSLTVRAWEPGDRIRSSRGESRKVKQLLSRAGVTGHKRAGWPVVLAGSEIVWIPGVRGSNITERLGTPGVPFTCEFIDR